MPYAAHLAARDGISTRTAHRRITAARQLGDEQAGPDGRCPYASRVAASSRAPDGARGGVPSRARPPEPRGGGIRVFRFAGLENSSARADPTFIRDFFLDLEVRYWDRRP